MKKNILFILCFALMGIKAGECDVFSDFVNNPSYKVEGISETEYNDDNSGQVFSSYEVVDGKPIVSYWRYELIDKTYNETVSKTGSGEGDGIIVGDPGSFAKENVGLGINNSGNLAEVNDVLYKGNEYTYSYTGDDASVFVRGGVVFNEGTIGTAKNDGSFDGMAIKADFLNNKVTSSMNCCNYVWVDGAVVANFGNIGGIEGNFIKNSAKADVVRGVGVYNDVTGYISSLKGSFLSNTGVGRNVKGGSIFNMGRIGEITGDFIANSITASGQANGGVIQNNDENAKIDVINGMFVDNQALGGVQAWGGVIDNINGSISKISGTFNNNLAEGNGTDSDGIGGAISNQGNINEISGDFVANTAKGTAGGYGGAIYSDTVLNTVSGDFIGNKAVGEKEAYGGAIYYEGDGLVLHNSNFYNNSANASSGNAFGGAIYANRLRIEADGADSVFSGNTVNGLSNALYIEEKGELDLSASQGGRIIFDDDIDGSNYNINVLGDGSGSVDFNGVVDNVKTFQVDNQGIARLGTAGRIETNRYIGQSDSVLQLDVAVDSSRNVIRNGVINVAGDVEGETKVVINSLNTDKLKSNRNAVSVFLNAPNDQILNDKAFTVSRVIGSPYAWDTFRNYNGETSGSTWYIGITDSVNKYMPEIPAYVGMQTALIEQSRNISQKVGDGLQANRYKGCCDRKFLYPRDMWVNADYTYAEIDAPSEMDAKIKGVTAGVDLYTRPYLKFGVFGRYSQGDYDLSGKGRYRSSMGSDLDIDSYLGGLYYRFERYNFSVLGTLFAGKQDVKTGVEDSAVKASVDSMLYGGSVNISRRFPLSYAWVIEPSLGIYYAVLDTDDFSDSLGQRVEFDLMQYIEAELGLKLEHLFCVNGLTGKFYAKPSIIQTYALGDKMNMDIFSSSDIYKNQTLGKMEIGAKFGLTSALSTYFSANYTLGNSYKAYGADAGLAYSW